MSSNNENGNLMDEFEEAFQACLLSLTKQEPNTGTTKEEIELEVQKTTNRFIDVARQMEAFFLQKRFLVSTLKPDMLIKDENTDLRIELQRKEQLLYKHYNRLEEWKAILADSQSANLRPPGTTGGLDQPPQMGIPRMPMAGGGISMMPGTSAGGSSGIPGGHQHMMQQPKMMTQQMQQQQLRMMNKFGGPK